VGVADEQAPVAQQLESERSAAGIADHLLAPTLRIDAQVAPTLGGADHAALRIDDGVLRVTAQRDPPRRREPPRTAALPGAHGRGRHPLTKRASH